MTQHTPCGWAPLTDPLYRSYHDLEWGVQERRPQALWAKLQLDGMQAGLSWITVLRKRETIREVFEDFDPERLASWTDSRIRRALDSPGIIRSPAKAAAVVANARAYLQMMSAGEDFADFCWQHVGHRQIVNRWKDYRQAPTHTDWSAALASDLKKRGFSFVGPTIVYAWAQAVGMVNDHEIGCVRHRQVQERS